MSRFDKNVIATLNRIAAQKIFEKMRILRMSSTENSKRRWIWELLQNANDKGAIDFPDEQVAVRVRLTDDSIEFSHNYSYFTNKNIEGLIRQISSDDKDWGDTDKTEMPKTIGRFGTGFLTTHLLSEKVNVKGLFQDEGVLQRFSFPLDRSGRELKSLIESINNSFEEVNTSLNDSPHIENPDFSACNTTFEYELDESGKAIAEVGLDDLENSLPYTLIFIDKIKRVEIERSNCEKIVYEKQAPTHLTKDIKIVEFDKIQGDRIQKLYFACLSEELTSIAIQIDRDDNQTSILPFNNETPKIFLGFPLIGTEDFNFPVVINNPFLEPTEPRDGVFLTMKNEENIINNKKIVRGCVELYFILLQYAIDNDWQNLYLLAKTDLPNPLDWVSTDWYAQHIQKVLRARLMQSSIVYTDNPLYPKIQLAEALFPYAKSKSKISTIWDFANAFLSDCLPKKEHIGFWYEIIDNSWGKDLRYTLKRLVADVARFSNVTQLSDKIHQFEEEALHWLNKLIGFVLSEERDLLSEFAIIPNQYGEFKKREELWTDKDIPEELKDILKILQQDWRSKLKHNQITSCELAIAKSIQDIVDSINRIIKENTNPKVKDAVLGLIACFPADSSLSKNGDEVLGFAKDFYPTPDKKILANWIPGIWQECQEWFMNQVCHDIDIKQNVANLAEYLNQDALKWLSDFVKFAVKYNFESYFMKYAILPNQKGDFACKKQLYADLGVDEELKDILEELGDDCRSRLLAVEIELDLDGKIHTSEDIAREITKRVEAILKNEGLDKREERNKRVFSKLLLWFYENESLAEKIFGDLYDRRYRLRSDEEIIEDIKFRQAIVNNKNGYTEQEILELINTPKEELFRISPEDFHKFEQWKHNQSQMAQQVVQEEYKELVTPQELLTRLCIYSPEMLELARRRFRGTRIYEYLRYIPHDFAEYPYVEAIIRRAKNNIIAYLSQTDGYNCDRWYEQSTTVIGGITKNDRPITIVVRPSDRGQVILFYKEEFDALEYPETELWVDNDIRQEIITLGRVLKNTGINRIPL
ncbi:hypothetical protein AB0758_33005 [Tolypothrix bouteillei VB521301_2]|uniref:ATPase n=3 Tax=Tolypothrix bouteillei VB521301 TaxID=1479485 RepID=A0A8S9SVW4_9CYAN|nr:hypothetical protein [Tolypothrix bouteillei]KAF3884086.1 hypothetical protein DA73_0400000145 [Tolypothrix bouteillei VB521301]